MSTEATSISHPPSGSPVTDTATRPSVCARHGVGHEGLGRSTHPPRVATVAPDRTLRKGGPHRRPYRGSPMIFITAKFRVSPRTPTAGPRSSTSSPGHPGRAGCLWFDWSRSVEDPTSTCSSRRSGTTRPAARTSSPTTSRRAADDAAAPGRDAADRQRRKCRRRTGPCSARWRCRRSSDPGGARIGCRHGELARRPTATSRRTGRVFGRPGGWWTSTSTSCRHACSTSRWAYFDAAGPLLGRRWPIEYRWPQERRLQHLRNLGVRRFPTLRYPHKPGMAAWLNDWCAEFAAAGRPRRWCTAAPSSAEPSAAATCARG